MCVEEVEGDYEYQVCSACNQTLYMYIRFS